jgi:hypothetical protein
MEGIKMFSRKNVSSLIRRAAAMATASAMALSAVGPSPALAGAAPAGTGLSAVTAASGATDISARRRHHHSRGGGAAAAAIFAGIVGTGLAIAAAQSRRDYYDDYYGGPAYYGGPGYYGGGPYYGYHGHRHWRHAPFVRGYPRW